MNSSKALKPFSSSAQITGIAFEYVSTARLSSAEAQVTAKSFCERSMQA
jgi:hypothetical protein